MSLRYRIIVVMIVACLVLGGGIGGAAADSPRQSETDSQSVRLAADGLTGDAPVQELLVSLTRDDYSLRECVVERLADGGTTTAAELVRLASDEASPHHLQARYMIRRTFWNLAPTVMTDWELDDIEARRLARETFRAMAEVFELDTHHHGGLHKVAVVMEQLGRHDLALDYYRRWDPPNTGCGTCTTSIRAEKTEAVVRCLRATGQLDDAIEFCLAELRSDDPLSYVNTSTAISLVDICEKENRLDELTTNLEKLDPDRYDVAVALDYLTILRDVSVDAYDRLLPMLTGETLTYIDDTIEDGYGQYTWRPFVIAEALGRKGTGAIEPLAKNLKEGRRRVDAVRPAGGHAGIAATRGRPRVPHRAVD